MREQHLLKWLRNWSSNLRLVYFFCKDQLRCYILSFADKKFLSSGFPYETHTMSHTVVWLSPLACDSADSFHKRWDPPLRHCWFVGIVMSLAILPRLRLCMRPLSSQRPWSADQHTVGRTTTEQIAIYNHSNRPSLLVTNDDLPLASFSRL